MSVNWTREQTQVIESRNKNLLVSAAAGSGKTAVLVERIIQMVTDPEHPVDIDKLLVMTFTNAAAAEMRERVHGAIEKRLAATPGDVHLQIQAGLVHHAQITTIDSFCLNLIRNYFNRLELDPAFRIGDEGELTLLRADVMEKLLEDYYEQGGERFESFVETYAQGKSDAGIDDYIRKVYTFSQSNPYPDQWLAGCRKELQELAGEDWLNSDWLKFLMTDAGKQLQELMMQLREAREICETDEVLAVYEPTFFQEVRQLMRVSEAQSYEELNERLATLTWNRLPAVRSKEVDGAKKGYVTGCRNRVKKAVSKMKELYAFGSPEEMQQDMEGTRAPIEMLLELTEEFSRRYQEKKRERNLVDFNDMEHEALHVLIDWQEGVPVYTDVADELSMQYEEILIDEYQDSNLVQEALLHAVSRERFGQPNVFMVGDVKQSIYKFRLARPELFLEKYETYDVYGTEGSGQQKIELHQNFRSREQVLTGINTIFYRIMTENLGNIHYTEAVALHPGAVFAECEGNGAEIPELLLVDTGDASLEQLDEEAADFTAKEIEAKLIVARIREMTDPEHGLLIWDKGLNGQGGYRIAQYRDMAVLLRSTTDWTEQLLAIFMNEGIPAYAESRMGYFNTIEVETVLSLLAVIDNPMQDIPLAAVLKSPVVGLTDAELADMMIYYKNVARKGQDRGIYAAMHLYLAEHEQVIRKLPGFLELLAQLQEKSTYLPIHELIYEVYERTGYYNYVSAMPAGETRKANLDMLVEKAAAYEQTSYQGLFHFIRYIENLKKYNTDFGEASTIGEEDDTVRIMSIHKSKGLEFPIVFLAGTGKKFNKQDVYGKILIDPELGIGTDYLNLESRLKTATLKKNVLRRKMELENLGEELRVLYVALTRAKEKLIMTGTDRHLEKTLEKMAQIPLVAGQVPYTILSTAGSYLDWILMSQCGEQGHVKITQIPLSEIAGAEVLRQVKTRQSKEQLLQLDTEQVYEEEVRVMLEQNLSYVYPYAADIQLHTKMSVSELKQQGQMVDDIESRQLIPMAGEAGISADSAADSKLEPASAKPRIWASDAPADGGYGATRGTAYHRAMELLPFEQISCMEDIPRYLTELVQREHFAQENYELIDAQVIWQFLQSRLGQRMTAAARAGRLHKEQQFVMGIPAREMNAGDTDELVVVQGIIDAWMEEGGQIVLMDYKTDKIKNPQILSERYRKQLDYYQRALEQMTGKTVKEKVIYSLTMQREISC